MHAPITRCVAGEAGGAPAPERRGPGDLARGWFRVATTGSDSPAAVGVGGVESTGIGMFTGSDCCGEADVPSVRIPIVLALPRRTCCWVSMGDPVVP